jgi:hypothetical protein
MPGRLILEQLEDRTLPSSFTAATVSDLIADINAANAAGGSNTITLAPKTTFTLTQVNNTTSEGSNGLPVIAANDNLTIVGNGDTIQRNSTSAAFRFFEVAGGASLALNDMKLKYGSAGAGGGIYNLGTLTVSGCTLSYNSAGVGGGIYNLGTCTVQNSTLSHNSADAGGGIYNNQAAGFLTVSASTITKNSATEDGGGIYDASSYEVFITNGSDVCGNSAQYGADAWVGSGASFAVSNSTVCIIYYATVG